jgi:hypothetical protein
MIDIKDVSENDEETALMKLKYWRFNVLWVIKDYLNPDFNKPKKIKAQTTNQRMMSEIRGFCERGQKIYDLQQERLARQQEKLSRQQENQKINQN